MIDKKTRKKETVPRAPGGGRKLKYGEEVKIIPIKCPISKEKEFKELAYKILEKWEK